MKSIAPLLIVLAMTGSAHRAEASTLSVTVDGRSGPWNQAVNPDLPYDSGAFAPTIVASPVGHLAAGTAYNISFVSGETQTVSFYSPTDGRGYANIQAGVGYPSQYAATAGQVAYLQELMGAFADTTGKVVGTPFLIGNGGSFLAPIGASEILLGINDNHYADNLGALTVSVSGTNLSAVPLPGSAPLLGAALLALGAVGYSMKRRQAAA